MLQELGFEVNLMECQFVQVGTTYHPEIPFTHGFLIVIVDGQRYLFDPGFALRSPKYPLPIDLEKDD